MAHCKRALVLLVLGLLALLLLPGAIHAQGVAPTLTLQVPAQATMGEPVTIQATLTEPDGSPIAGALVRFLSPMRFLSYSGDVALGEVRTDASGTAALSYEPRTGERVTIVARFLGAAGYSSAEASAPMTVAGSATLYQEKAGIKVPGIGAWLLAAILGTVWSVFLVVFVLVALIAKAGVTHPDRTWGTS